MCAYSIYQICTCPCTHTASVSLLLYVLCTGTPTLITTGISMFVHTHGRKEFAAEIQPGRKRPKKKEKEKGKEGENSPSCGEMEGFEEVKLRVMGGAKSPCGVVLLVAFLGLVSAGWDSPV